MSFRFKDHIDKYPPVISRAQVSEYFPWISPKHLANLAHQKKGPEYIRHGKAALYPTAQFLDWLDASIKTQAVVATGESQEPEPEARTETKTDRPAPGKRRGRKTKAQEVRERRMKL